MLRAMKRQVSRSSPVRLWLSLGHACGLCLLDDDPADVQEDHKVCLWVKSHTDDSEQVFPGCLSGLGLGYDDHNV